jgi:molybdate transport system substrate-binding protein
MRFPFFALALLLASAPLRAEEAVRVFAAASLTNALNDIGAVWQKAGHPAPSLAYAASAALARQIDAGAPADLFASADLKWMDYLDTRARLQPGTRINLLGNQLVLIAPGNAPFTARLEPGSDLATRFGGRLCTGEPGAVPVGTYAKQGLTALGLWDALAARLVGTEDVRAALAFVERGECGAGIVYATDAAISAHVTVVGTFPAATHDPIVYPFALVKDARAPARDFLDFLGTAPASAIFRRYGFDVLAP